MFNQVRVLKLLNRCEEISQREIAERVGISVGSVNAIINELLKEDLIINRKSGRKFAYNITESGIQLLEQLMKCDSEERIKLHKYEANVSQAVILAAGKSGSFKTQIGLLELSDEKIVDRTVKILRENGINDIILVAGFKSEEYENYCMQNNIRMVVNKDYKWTGTMASLAKAKDLITGDFLLIESDHVFERQAIKELMKSPNRDCIVITNESGSGDEAFVEIRNNSIVKISKDKHMFNKIDGEMLGISKISYEFFNIILDYYKGNINPYLNYEYAILDASRFFDIGYVKIDDLIWSEIDTEEHYDLVVNHIYPRIKRKDVLIQTNELKSMLVKSLDVKDEEISEILPAGGMTNKNYKVKISGEDYILRVPGAGTEEMISRSDEKKNSQIGWKLKIDTELLYFNEVSGIKVSKFIDKAETLTGTSAKKKENMEMTTELLKRLHNSGEKFDNRFDIIGKIELYEELVKKAGGSVYEDYYELREKVVGYDNLLKEMGVQEVACHNDTVPENFVKSGEGKMYLIDWEYSGMNDPMWDLAAHSIECNFSEDDEELFLNIYFGHEPSEEIRKRILINKIFQDFLWSLWTVLKEAKGDDFGTYGIDRYNRAKKNINILG